MGNPQLWVSVAAVITAISSLIAVIRHQSNRAKHPPIKK